MFAVSTHDFTRGQLSVPLFISGDRADQHCSSPSAGDGGLIASPEIQGDEGLNHPQTNLCVPQGQSRAKHPPGRFLCLFVLPLRSCSRPKRKAGAVLTLGFSTRENESEKQQCNIPCAFPWLCLSHPGSRVTPGCKSHLMSKPCCRIWLFPSLQTEALCDPPRALGAWSSQRLSLSPLLPPFLPGRAGGSWVGCQGPIRCSGYFLDGAVLIYSLAKEAAKDQLSHVSCLPHTGTRNNKDHDPLSTRIPGPFHVVQKWEKKTL